jgi:uncharacterized membrane protein YgcG
LKKSLSAIIILSITLVLCLASAPVALAQEAFSIDDYSVDVKVNDDRSYDVTETINLTFNEQRRGIIRSIPTAGSLESYEIINVSVGGEPFILEETADSLDIRIGDPDVYLKGEKKYIISYTLRHWADADPQADWLYLNLIGNDWDTTIEQVNITIDLPSPQLLDHTINVGTYGATGGSDKVKVTTANGIMKITNKEPLAAHEGITLMAQFPQGVFSQAREKQYPYVINNYDMLIDADSQRNLQVTETIDLTFNENINHLEYYLPYKKGSNNALSVKNFSYQGPGQAVLQENTIYIDSVTDPSLDLSSQTGPTGQNARLVFSYQVLLPLEKEPDYDYIFMDVIGGSWDTYIKKAALKINFPTQPQHYDYLLTGSDQERLQARLVGSTLFINTTGQLLPYEGITFKAIFPPGTFAKSFTGADLSLICLALLALGLTAVFFFRYGRDKALVPPVEFYPPDGLNPAQIGYIIDYTAHNRDATSLLFYWASRGHLRIEEKGKTFTLYKESDLDESYTEYEREAFAALWQLGSDDSVREYDLREAYYSHINNIKKGVTREFTRTKPLLDKKAKIFSYLALGIGVIPVFFLFLLSFWNIFDFQTALFIAVAGGIVFFIIASIMRAVISNVIKNWYKRSRFKSIVYLIIIIIIVAIICLLLILLSSYGYVYPVAAYAVTIAFAVILFWSPFINRRSTYGQEILQRVVGFRNFLLTAEKEKMELLIKEDPGYFYNILPYALALGVTDVFAKKFDGLVLEPPNWYYSDSWNTFGMLILISSLNRTMYSAQSSMTALPKSQGGGGNLGGGGGFYGGGFSGGGSGGGGGSSW